MPPKKQASLDELLKDMASGLHRVATRPDANSYNPHQKQTDFHQSLAKGRLYIGGNRSGKTVAGVIEDIWWLSGTHPFRETPELPVRGRLVCVDFPNGWEKIVKPVVQQWIPPSLLIDGSWQNSWNSRTRTLTLANGSFLEIMSYDQDLESFAGASRHFTHFDEEPPSSIWTECKARLIDTGGSWWISMTPVEGMTWVYDKIYEPFISDSGNFNTDVIEVDMTENTYLSPVEVEEFLSDLDVNERKARKQGKFVQIGGLIFKDFNPDIHVIQRRKNPIPFNWRIVASLDHGYNHPTAWYFHAVSPSDEVVTFAEHYKSEMTVKQHIEAVKAMEKEIGRPPEFYIGDPAIRQRSGINGNSIQLEYNINGIPVKAGNNDVKVGINRMISYQRRGKWFITENCPNLIREMRRYKWKTRATRKLQEKHGSYDEPEKKMDDAIDSCRYFFTSMPELAPKSITIDMKRQRDEIQAMLNGKIGYNITKGRLDDYLNRNFLTPPIKKYPWSDSVDENVGEF